MPEEKNHAYRHLTSYDQWCRDMGSNKTSGEEACSGPAKHGEIVVKHHEKRYKIQNEIIRSKSRGERCNRESVVHERTVGRTSSQNEQHQVGQDNIRIDTQRRKTSKREIQKEMEKQHRGSW